MSLPRARSGASLPVGQLKVARYCELSGDHTALASLAGGAPLSTAAYGPPLRVPDAMLDPGSTGGLAAAPATGAPGGPASRG